MTRKDARSLKATLYRLHQEDPEFRVFGAETHRYQLGPPLSEETLSAFEQLYEITLPEEYRFFLKAVGDGGARRSSAPFIAINCGAGPNYGLFPLEDTVADADLLQPFPLVPRNIDEPVAGDNEWGDTKPMPGALTIAYAGCAYFTILAIRGSNYGTVWETDFDLQNYYPTGLTFLTWYRCWLDNVVARALPILANERIVSKIQIGMTKAEVIRLVRAPWKVNDFGKKLRFLRFAQLASEFQIDENDIVTRIVNHSISPTGMYQSGPDWNDG